MNINELQPGSYTPVGQPAAPASLNIKDLQPGSYTSVQPANQPVQTPAPTPSPFQRYFNGVGAAFNAGKEQIQEALTPPETPPNPVESLENTAKLGAGIVNAASSPLAPLFSPLGKLIGYVSDKVSDIPAVQNFAASPAGQATSRVAQDVQNVSTVAGAVAGGEGSAPVEAALSKAGTKVTDTAGNAAAQGLGATTGAGASSIKTAFNGGQAFVDALRGNVTPDDVIETAQNAVQNIAENRRQTYIADLKDLGKNNRSLDTSPIHDVLDQKLSAFGVKVNDDGTLDFSRSSIANNGSARSDVQGVYDTLRSWGTQEGDRTPVGLDTLKKQLADFYSPSGSARALVQAVKGKVSDILNAQVPGYKTMTAKYAQASQLLDDIKSATGIGGKAKADTVFTKLTTAMKGDKDFRLEMLGEMQAKGAQPDLMDQIAGLNLQSIVPRGLVGKGADVGAAFAIIGHYFAPQYIPMLLATSPRVVGEFVHALGMTKNAANAIMGAINKGTAKTVTGASAASPQSTLQSGPLQSNKQ